MDDRAGDKKGYFGLKFPTAVSAVVMAGDTDCSMYPNIGSLVTGTRDRSGGNLWGSLRSQ